MNDIVCIAPEHGHSSKIKANAENRENQFSVMYRIVLSPIRLLPLWVSMRTPSAASLTCWPLKSTEGRPAGPLPTAAVLCSTQQPEQHGHSCTCSSVNCVTLLVVSGTHDGVYHMHLSRIQPTSTHPYHRRAGYVGATTCTSTLTQLP